MSYTMRSTAVWMLLLFIFASVHINCVLAQDSILTDPNKNIRSLRSQAAHRQRRIIQNNDGCDAWFYCKDATDDGLLNVWTKGLEKSCVDTIFYCTQTGVGTVTHNSKIATPMTATTGNFKDNMVKGFLDRGTDPLRIVSEFCRKNDVEIFASFRMNDIHSGDLEADGRMCDPELHSPWKTQHPEYLLGERGGKRVQFFGQSRAWAGANYELPEVREYVYKTIEEVCINYDIDGVELDFFRHPLYFKSHVWQGKAGEKERAIMTEFVSRLRKMMDRESLRRGRVLLLSIRVPDSVGFCRDIGLDVEEWLKKGLVDILVPGGYFQLRPWKKSVELGHRYNVPVYPCLEDSRDIDEGNSRLSRNSKASCRARALQALSSGADGIYLFDAIYLWEPNDIFYTELGDASKLKGQSQTYFVNVMGTEIIDGFLSQARKQYLELPELNRSSPLILPKGQAGRVWIDVPVRPMAKAVLKVAVEKKCSPSEISVKLNERELTDGQLVGSWAIFPVNTDNVKEGKNWFDLENKSEAEIKFLDLQLLVEL